MMTYLILTWSGIQLTNEAKQETFEEDNGLDTVAVTGEIIEGKEVEMNVLLPPFQVHTARETGQESPGGRRIELQTEDDGVFLIDSGYPIVTIIFGIYF